MNPICIYHGNCADGFGAAWVVRQHFKRENRPIDFHAGVYNDDPPDVTDREVFIVDFSYKRHIMEVIRDKAFEVTVLDHHKSAIEDLAGLKGINTVFDVNRSGATITWDYFFPDTTRPRLLEHIEDRDLWRFKLPGTREIQANLFSYPYDFLVWDGLMMSDLSYLVSEGGAIERKHHKDIAELLKVMKRRMNIGGFNVPVANLPYIHSSDAGMIMSENEPFAACYWHTPEWVIFSLRSNGDKGMDVSKIAAQYGGGGHKAAAGFRVSYAQAREFEV